MLNPLKKHANSWEETQPDYISFQTLHFTSLCEGAAAVGIFWTGKEE